MGAGTRARPYLQGDLDGLCGIYAAVNALVVLAARQRSLPRSTCVALFRQGLAVVSANTSLADAVVDGIEPDLWFAVVQRLAKTAGDQLDLEFRAVRLFEGQARVTRRRMRRGIELALDASAVVLVSLSGAHDHYGLITAHTATRFVMSDSGQLRWLCKDACGTERSSRRHQIACAWVVAICVRPP